MDELIKPRMEEEKKKLIQQTRDETTETSLTAVRQKIKEQFESEQAAREAEGKQQPLGKLLSTLDLF